MFSLRPDKAQKFYLIASLFLVTGWLWFLWVLSGDGGSGATVCIFKNVTGIPCPACGSTTSLAMIAGGDWKGAVLSNPLGYVIGLGLLVLPIWLLVDIVSKRTSLQKAIRAFDKKVKRQPFILLLILVPIILNWIWNIMKM